MANSVAELIKADLNKFAEPYKVKDLQRFFKTKPGEYAEGDVFIGVRVPNQRKVVRRYFKDAEPADVLQLLRSEIHEHRLTALLIIVEKYKTERSAETKKLLFDMYNSNTSYCNNWDLVDSSAHYIAGAYAAEFGTEFLFEMAVDDCLWRNRIAMVASLYFIRNRQTAIVFDLAKLLLPHKHDLIHKAVGWMLREAGKVDHQSLYYFLQEYYSCLPRTTLRYAIEKFDENERLAVLRGEFH